MGGRRLRCSSRRPRCCGFREGEREGGRGGGFRSDLHVCMCGNVIVVVFVFEGRTEGGREGRRKGGRF